MAPSHAVVTTWFEKHRSLLWGMCYRVTGSAADADDVVQETFIRAIERAPQQLDEPRRWLVKVALNASRDVLRRRRRRQYIGPWLPGPIETPDDVPPPSYEPSIEGEQTTEGRYDLMESVSLAFLKALEALTPTQRAVLLLADVFDYAAGEVASALDLTVGNVRTIHHRARRAMHAYERRRVTPTAANRQRTAKALEQLLAADVRAVTDGGGDESQGSQPERMSLNAL